MSMALEDVGGKKNGARTEREKMPPPPPPPQSVKTCAAPVAEASEVSRGGGGGVAATASLASAVAAASLASAVAAAANNASGEKEAAAAVETREWKHPLEHKWTFWYFKMEKNKPWEECQRSVSTVATVEDFWAVYNHMESVSRLQQGCDVALFKDARQRHSQHGHGGLDAVWLEVLLLLIGAMSEDVSATVNGAVANVRNRADKVALWTDDARKDARLLSIGHRLKETLTSTGTDPGRIVFEVHQDTMKKKGSTAQFKFKI